MFKDDPARMRKAAQYIEKHQGKTKADWLAEAYSFHPRNKQAPPC
jgi:hypothetical protein